MAGKRILVTGSRNWVDEEKIYAALMQALPVSLLIEGEARGADTIAKRAAQRLGIRVLPFRADWRRYGRSAGPIRNQLMLDEGKPDLVLAFHEDLARSKGTKDMISRARAAGVEVKLIS
jgi:hypothetical protein